MELPENCCLSCGAKLEYVQRIHLSYSVPLATLLILIISCSTDVAIWYCTFCVCVWKERNGERSSRERKQSNWIFWSPTRNSWSVTINAKCCTWHTLGGHVILPTPQLLLPVPLDGSRETTTSQPSWGGGHNIRRKKCRHALRDFCWRRLRWLYTSIFVVVSYVYIEAKMCGKRVEFSPIYGRQAKTNINCRPGRCCCCCFHSAQNAIF